MMCLQDAEPLIAYAAEVLQNTEQETELERPESLESLEEAGVETQSEETQNTETEEQSQGETSEEEVNEPVIELKEPQDYYPLPEEPEGTLVDYDAYSRTYKTGEEQYITVFGGYVGTYEDENGEIQLVDNTLIEIQAFSQTGTDFVQNQANEYVIQLPKNITDDAGIIVAKDDYYIEIIPLAGDYSHAVVKDNAILYNAVYEGVDVQYTVIDTSIKEDIVLLQPVEHTIFEYELNIPGLKAELVDNQVYLYPEESTLEDAKYLLEAPSMEDAAGEVSYNIVLSLREEDGKTILTVTPDQEWLADESRQYPIRIDPSTVNVGQESFSLIGVEEGSPNSHIGDNNYPYVGFDDGVKSGNAIAFHTKHLNCRTYIQVNADFSVIPEGSKIDSATFSISQRTNYSNGSSQFGLYRVDEAWNADTISWNNQPTSHTFIDMQYAAGAKHTYINYNIKELVNDWVQGTYANNGMVLKAITEANTLSAAMQCEVFNNRNSVYGPKITIQWSNAEDPYLRDMSLDDTTIVLRPMTEKSTNGLLTFDGIFVDGTAKSGATVSYYLTTNNAASGYYSTTAEGLYAYPNSAEFNVSFPNATIYNSKDSNWQSGLFAGLQTDTLYQIKARAIKQIDGAWVYGKEVSTDSFLIYQVKQFDTLPKIAQHYGVSLTDLMKDNQVQDALVVAGNTLFIRNPQTTTPYNTAELSDTEKAQIDGALMGRGLHCEFGFEPINLNTGNFYMNQTDATMTEFGGEFTISRTYNSLAGDRNSMFGRGWSFTYDQTLSPMADGTIIYSRGDGSYLYFTQNADGTYSAPAGYEYTLKKLAVSEPDEDDICWQVVDAQKTIWSFDKYGILRQITDVNGFVTTLGYNEAYKLTQITTASGKVFTIEQNDAGYITKITLPDAGTVSYTYDANGNLSSVTNPNGYTRFYVYDESHQMTSWIDENGNTVIVNEYDDQGRVIKQTDANGNVAYLSYGDHTTTTTDNRGNVTVYTYDELYRTTLITYPDGTTCEKYYNDANQLVKEVTANGTKTYTYDELGNVASETREDGAVAYFSYNAQNKLTSVTDYSGATVTYAYNGNGDLVSCTQADGAIITYTYDSLHRMTSQTDGRGVTTTYTYDGPNLISYVDGEGYTWSFTYDEMNRQLSATDPLGNTTKVSYDAVGNKLTETAADGGVIKYTRDKVGNILTFTDALGNMTSMEYDKMYNITKTTDAKGNVHTYDYNPNNELSSETDALGNVTVYTIDSMGRVTAEVNQDIQAKSYTYNENGNLLTYTDPNGNVITYEYNSQGLVTKIIDAEGNETTYSYDAIGRETQVTYANGDTVKTSYDAMGRITQKTTASGVVTTYTYDANGNLLTQTDDSGRSYSYVYDGNNKLVKTTNPEGGTETYGYDKAGRQISYTNAAGQTVVYGYDAVGNIISETDALGQVTTYAYDLNGNQVEMVDAEGNTTKFTYDYNGNLTSITDPLGNISAMKYDAVGNLYETVDALKGVTTYEYNVQGNITKATDALGNVYTYTYDSAGNNLKIVGPENATTTMTYNANGQLLTKEDVAGLKTTYTYDSLGRVISEIDTAGNEYYFTYDANGNITSETDALGRVTTCTYDKYGRLLEIEAADGSSTSYEYDVMDRIIAVTDAEGITTTFAYDAVGNQVGMTEEDAAVYTYAYDQLNRIATITDPEGEVSSYTYDSQNNVTSFTDANGTVITYEYDANGNLTVYTDGNGNTTTYEYDELNRLISETSALDEVKEYYYDALGSLTQYKDPEGKVTEYKYDALGNMIEQISPKGESTIYTYDLHGNVLSVTDPLGNVTSYEVNLNDQVTKMTQANGGVYTYEYDEVGRLEKVTTPLGYWTQFTYDAVDNIVEETNSLEQTTTYRYDYLHRLISSVDASGASSSFAYDIRGNVISETNALGYTTNYSYDTLGRLVEEKDPLGQATTYAYDPVGNLTEMLTPGGSKTTYSYDGNYNVISITDPMGYVTSYTYDEAGRVTQSTDPLNQTVSYAYNKNGQILQETDKAGYVTSYTYDAHGNISSMTDRSGKVTSYSYDANDNLIKVTDAAGNATVYEYNNMGWLTAQVSALGNTTQYTYDLEGNVTSRKDAADRVETMNYDAAGRLLSVVSPSGKTVCYDYDALNQLVEKSYEDAYGNEIEDSVLYGYDMAGQRISMTDAIGAAEYKYDVLGRLAEVKDSAGATVTYAYDANGNLKELGYPDGSKVVYTYDLNGNLTTVTDRDGKVTSYEYDGLNRLIKTTRPNDTVTYVTYDALDNVTSLVTRHAKNNRLISSYEYTYNEEGYIVSERVEESVVDILFELSNEGCHNYRDLRWKHYYEHLHGHSIFEHDRYHGDNCNQRHIRRPHGICNLDRTIVTELTYTYDENWQLTKCVETAQNKSTTTYEYTYDVDGNRTKYVKKSGRRVVESVTYNYNASNQLTSKTDQCKGWWGETTWYFYDKDGNLTLEGVHWMDYTTYEYTAENRLSVVRERGEVLMAALYDGDGNRLFTMDYTKGGKSSDGCGIVIPSHRGRCSETESATTTATKDLASLVSKRQYKNYTITQYVNDVNRTNEEVLMEVKANGRITTAYTYGNERISSDTGRNTSYYLYDGRGSVTSTTTSKGYRIGTYSYDPYGTLEEGTVVGVNYYGYNGESTNTNTGLQYLRARYYNSENGNFLTEDTYAGSILNPLTLNRYTYVLNNPLNFTDPTGHKASSRLLNKKAFDVGKKAVVGATTQVKDNAVQAVENTSSTWSWLDRYTAVQQAQWEADQAVRLAGIENSKHFGESIKERWESFIDFQSDVLENEMAMEQAKHKAMCDFGQTDTGKVVVNTTLFALNETMLAMSVVISGGTTLPVFAMSVAGGVSQAFSSGYESYKNGENPLVGASEGAVKGGLWGEGLGLIPPLAKLITKNPVGAGVLEAGLETLFEGTGAAANGTKLDPQTLSLGFITNIGLNNIDIPMSKLSQVTKAINEGKNLDEIISIIKGGSLSNDRVSYYLSQSLNNVDSSTTILGTTGTYDVIGETKGYSYFKMDSELWSQLESEAMKNYDEIWKVNKQFIDDQIDAGNRILLSNDPYQGYYFDDGSRRFYQREIDYLKELGYSFKSIGDNLWEAIK